uniref:MFS transporter n=1 Tax=Caenorhabditis tropicalis TaxID=1561998 RepID=A0A1I7UEW9_9PELO
MRKPLISIGLSQFGLSILQTLFMFYYVKVYINQFHVDTKWFNIAQTLFMFWNAINDPLFGYLQEIRGSWLNNRLLVIKTLAPFIAASFAFMWIPWNTDGSYLEGIHLILALFFYDAFFSAIGVAWGALFADTTQNQPLLRVKALKYSQIAIMVSAFSIAFTEKISLSLQNFTSFQVICFSAALLSFICLWFGGQLGQHSQEKDAEQQLILEEEKNAPVAQDNIKNSIQLTKQILSQKQFLAIVITNFFHTARSIAHMNFAAIITDIVIPQNILASGSLKKSLFFTLLTIGPQIVLILNEKLIGRVGAVKVAVASFIVSFFSGFMIIFSYNPYSIMLFMFIDCVTVHTIAPLFNIIISDFVDDDARKNNRPTGVASVIFSLNALFVKPAQSVAPVAIVYLLNQSGYQNYLKTKEFSNDLKQMILLILFMTPVVIGGIQYVIMKSMFNFRKPHQRTTHII